MRLTSLGEIEGVVPGDGGFLSSVFVQSSRAILTTRSDVQSTSGPVVVAEILVERLVVRQAQIDAEVALELQGVEKRVFREDVAESLEVVPLVIAEKRQGNRVCVELVNIVVVIPRRRIEWEIGERILDGIGGIGWALVNRNYRWPDESMACLLYTSPSPRD